MIFKDKIVCFCDALLNIFEGHNKKMYQLILQHRHVLRNLIPEQTLLISLKTFLSDDVIECIRNHDLAVLNQVSVQFGECIAFDMAVLLETCNINNQQIIWKWVNTIVDSVLEASKETIKYKTE